MERLVLDMVLMVEVLLVVVRLSDPVVVEDWDVLLVVL